MGFLSNIFAKQEPWMKEEKQYIFNVAQQMVTKGDAAWHNECFRRAQYLHDQKYPGAASLLGTCYHRGIGTAVNYAKAIHYYQYAIKEGYSTKIWLLGANYAYFQMAEMYAKGEGVPVDCVKAMEYYKTAEQRGVPLSTIRIGELYLDGKGVSKEPQKAMECFKKELTSWNYLGLTRIADMYATGNGVPQDLEIAKNMYGCAVHSSFKRNKEAQEKLDRLS